MKKKILIIGGEGMIGSAIVKYFSQKKDLTIFTTVSSLAIKNSLLFKKCQKIFSKIDLEENKTSLPMIFNQISPDIVINCIGVVKQSTEISDYDKTIYLNAVLPHYLANLCANFNCRFIHISSDCVFSGTKGNYKEIDSTDPEDLYGKSKLMGETVNGNALTLRVSVIGHEIKRYQGIVEWFLSQNKTVEGYQTAIFSGLTSYEFAKVLYTKVIPNSNLKGLYHVSSNPISKHDLLNLIKKIYKKKIDIIPSTKVIIDRSLNSSIFRNTTGYFPIEWPKMIKEMKKFND
jgi:dTDP-4-dehydrorhamnose reductase